MFDSLLILGFFLMGLFCGTLDFLPDGLATGDSALWALWLLMGLAGLSVGADKKIGDIARKLKPAILLLPVSTTAGTFLGTAFASIFLSWSLFDCLAVGAGFGYYSLSAIFITKFKGADLGAIALFSNILRELFTLLTAPMLMKLFGPAAVISAGGCTTSDTTFPVIVKYAGKSWIGAAVIHAVVLDFSVPFWVSLFCLW